MDKSTHNVRRQEWISIINTCIASGMSKKAWCEANGINEKSFYYWQRQLRNVALIEQKHTPALADSSQEPPVAFVELKANDSEPYQTFHPDAIVRKGETVFEISNSASPELLKLLGGLIHAK